MKIENNVLRWVDSSDIIDGHFDCPEEVTHIDSWAFYNREVISANLRNVTCIEGSAFYQCPIKNISMPNVIDIDHETFGGCYALTSVVLPNVPKVDNLLQKLLNAVKDGAKLNMRMWHTCSTVHCHAGWVVRIAKAFELEKQFGTAIAALAIYTANGYSHVSMGDFFLSDREAFFKIKEAVEKAPLS